MSSTCALVGFAHSKPERREDLRELLLSFVEPTRAEQGCLEYHFHVDSDDPSVFVFYELWRSRADLDRHLALPHMQDFWNSRLDYLTRDLDIRWIDMLSPYPG